MKPTRRLALVVGLVLSSPVVLAPLHAQGSRADYERSERFEELTRGKVFRERVDPQWLPGGERFWYRVDTGPGQHEFVLVDAGEGWRRPATSTATST